MLVKSAKDIFKMPEADFLCHRLGYYIYLNYCAVRKVIDAHLDVYCHAFDPIKLMTSTTDKQQQRSPKRQIKYHFLPPLLLIALIYVDTLYVLYTENFKLKFHSELFTSKILPEDFWVYGGTLLYIGVTMQLTIYGNLFIRSTAFPTTSVDDTKRQQPCPLLCAQIEPVSEAVKLLRDNDEDEDDRKDMSEELLQDLLHIRSKVYRCMAILYVSSVLQFESFHLWQLCRHWSVSSSSSSATYGRNLLYLLLLPPLLLYTAYANVLFICYFILTSLYILRRQFTYLKQMRVFQSQNISAERRLFYRRLIRTKKERKVKCHSLWREFTQLNGHFLALFAEMRSLEHFWSPFLTAVYAYHILLICYMAFTHYAVSSQLAWFYRSFFLFFAAILSSTLIALTVHSSAIVHNNARLAKLNSAFCFAYSSACSPLALFADLIRVNNNYKW